MTTNAKFKILVYGWYHQHNLGDDMFVEAFTKLFPDCDLKFVNFLSEQDVSDSDAIFFGGGSFLDNQILCEPKALELAESKPIWYIGVGLETDVHEHHAHFMSMARLVAARSPVGLSKSSVETLVIPDLVHCLYEDVQTERKGILYVPNAAVVPTNLDPQWKHAAWTYFKSEMSQFLDWAVSTGSSIKTLLMCRNDRFDDIWPAAEIIGSMSSRQSHMLDLASPKTASEAAKIFASNSIVIAQRFHGTVLAEMTDTPYISLVHHQKLATGAMCLPYYGITKSDLIQAMQSASPPHRDHQKDRERFEMLCDIVMEGLKRG